MNDLQNRAVIIYELLSETYPAVSIALNFSTPFELLIATVLSAQCTDKKVNEVTESLFAKYRSPSDYLTVAVMELERDIFSTGFYKQKAKSIKGICEKLITEFSGNVPQDFEVLVTFPGVGRKTASAVLGNAFGIPAIAVDTHVKRISNLLGLVASDNPDSIEYELKKLLLKEYWVNFSHLIATHGRTICFARKPKCTECVLQSVCPSANV